MQIVTCSSANTISLKALQDDGYIETMKDPSNGKAEYKPGNLTAAGVENGDGSKVIIAEK